MEDAQPTAQSPDVSPVQLRDCIEELLRAVLEWSIDGTLGVDIGISPEFCSALLDHGERDDRASSVQPSSSIDISVGVPLYPLYKYLATALHQSIASGSFFSRYNEEEALLSAGSLSKQIKEEWEDLLTSKGSELLTILKNMNYQLSVQEPFFSQLKDGSKTVEGRCAVGDYNRICSGDLILFNKCLVMEVLDVHHCITFAKMLEMEGLSKVLPGVTTVQDGVQIYRNFYTEEKEKLNGVVAIAVSKIGYQPCIVLANIIASLSYQGIQSLLGFQHTAGTVTEALSPASSILLSSFTQPYRPDVKGCTLTVGARALTKHINRCGCGYWGQLEGNDSVKNELAMAAIRTIIVNCSWMNVHIVKPHEAVFEIRVPEGYGARWSRDGRQFIGFLEPHMEDGYLTKWRH